VMEATFALLAIGARHEPLRDEVREALAQVPQLTTDEARSWAQYLCEACGSILSAVDGLLADHHRLGASMAFDVRERYPESSPYRHYARAEDVPADVAFSHPFQWIADFTRQPDLMIATLGLLATAARALPEELYLPRRCLEFLEPKWEPEDALQLMEVWLAGAEGQAPRPTGPTRNGPCPCGSGKKYKRCCGTAETA
jgi:hypothetical protein